MTRRRSRSGGHRELIPFNAVCYAAGITHVRRPRYAWTTAVGIAPLCIVVTYLGSRLQTVGPTDWRLWALTLGLLGLLMLAHRLLPSSGDPPQA